MVDDFTHYAGPVDLSDWAGLDLAGISTNQLVDTVLACDPTTVDDVKELLSASWACEHLLRTLSARQATYFATAVNRIDDANKAAKAERAARKAQSTQAAKANQVDETTRIGETTRDDPFYDAYPLDGIDRTSAEISPRYVLTKGQAAWKVTEAHHLATDLPELLALVHAGRLDLRRAALVDRTMRAVLEPGGPLWKRVGPHIASIAPLLTNHQLEYAVRQAIEAVDPLAAQNRHKNAHRARNVTAQPLPDGMGAVTATVSADDALLADEVLDALADACRDHCTNTGNPDQRTHQQRRADAHSAIFRAIADHTALPLIHTPQQREPAPANEPEREPATTNKPEPASTPVPERVPERVPEPGPESEPVPVPTSEPSEPPKPGSTTEPEPAPEPAPDPLAHDLDHAMFGGTVLPPDAPATDLGATTSDVVPYPSGVLAWWMPSGFTVAPRRGFHLYLTMAASTYLGHDELPAHLPGIGPIPANLARKIAAHPDGITLIRIPTGPHPSEASSENGPPPANPPPPEPLPNDLPLGLPASIASWSLGGPHEHGPGDTKPCPNQGKPYRPSQKLTKKVIGLHQRCTYRGCTARAERCDLDHVRPYGKGGSTCACNLQPLCRTQDGIELVPTQRYGGLRLLRYLHQFGSHCCVTSYVEI
jgi:hypothetical protein